MKSTLALILILSSAQAFATTEKDVICYSAQNPSAISVEPIEGKPETSTGVEANLKIATHVYDQKADGFEGSMRMANLKVRTNLKWKVEVSAFLNDAFNSPTFSVECDGGSMTAKEIDFDTVVLNSEYIAGEMTKGNEGCSSARLQFKDLVMKKSECK